MAKTPTLSRRQSLSCIFALLFSGLSRYAMQDYDTEIIEIDGWILKVGDCGFAKTVTRL